MATLPSPLIVHITLPQEVVAPRWSDIVTWIHESNEVKFDIVSKYEWMERLNDPKSTIRGCALKSTWENVRSVYKIMGSNADGIHRFSQRLVEK